MGKENRVDPNLQQPVEWQERKFTPMGFFPTAIAFILLILYFNGLYKLSPSLDADA